MLFGLITIPEYIYRYKLSKAKIELMMLDLPRVEYIKDTENGDPKPKRVKVSPTDKAVKLQEEANKKAAKRREWQEKKLSDLGNDTQTNTNE